MAIDPIKIPQNVHIEDHIVGPLTLKQILLICIGCGFSYALWATLSKTGPIALPVQVLIWVPGALSLIFAFVRVNDLSMLRLCLLMLERMQKPSIRTWTPRRGIVVNIRTFSTPKKQEDEAHAAAPREQKMQQLNELSTMLDQPLDPVAPEEPMESQEAELLDTRPMQPVDKNRIVAEPLNDKHVDGIGTISLFHTSSPAH